jgi:hypothetical protein
MNLLKTTLLLAGFVGVMSLTGSNLMAQDTGSQAQDHKGNGHHAHLRSVSNMETFRHELGFSADILWAEISRRIAGVLDARLALVGELDRGLGEPRDIVAISFGPEGKAESALRQAVRFDASDDALKAHLASVRIAARAEQEAREQAYLKAQDDLRAVLTPRQEAKLTLDGVLQ